MKKTRLDVSFGEDGTWSFTAHFRDFLNREYIGHGHSTLVNPFKLMTLWGRWGKDYRRVPSSDKRFQQAQEAL